MADKSSQGFFLWGISVIADDLAR